MKNWGIEKWKVLVEIIAILGAGLFAFLTWGIDELRLRADNWHLKIDDVSEAIVNLNNNKVCDYKGTLYIYNNSKTPLYIGDTKLDFYLVDRPKETINGVTESSIYPLTRKICRDLFNCGGRTHTTTIGSIDEFPIPPGSFASRPFNVQFDKTSMTYADVKLEDELKDHVLLIRVKQEIEGYEKPSMLAYYDSSVCPQENEKEKKVTQIKEKLTKLIDAGLKFLEKN